MSEGADEVIEALKKRFRVQTDLGLAERLHLGRTTVSSWRRRGAVPPRYVQLASEVPTLLPDFADPRWDATERSALTLALVRLILVTGKLMTDYSAFLQKGGFLPAQLAVGVEKALLDLSAKMEEGEIEDAGQALNIIVFEEFFRDR